jgi:hypothetical protein
MARNVGIWINRRKALVITVDHDGVGIRSIQSDVKKQVCFSGIQSQDGWTGNMQDSRFKNFLVRFYDEVITIIDGADAIQIFGPGETKFQLEQRLRQVKLGERIVSVLTVDKMSERQIEARVLDHYMSLLGRPRSQHA